MVFAVASFGFKSRSDPEELVILVLTGSVIRVSTDSSRQRCMTEAIASTPSTSADSTGGNRWCQAELVAR